MNRAITLFIIVALIVLGGMLYVQGTKIANGSVNDSSNAYQSTTTRTAVNGNPLTSPTTLTNGYGTLGSVVITGANTGIINIYDASTTVNGGVYGTTTLATFPASTVAGTYVFDVAFKYGLLVEISGTVGSSTITWKK